jgi:hypothetical protein
VKAADCNGAEFNGVDFRGVDCGYVDFGDNVATDFMPVMAV